MGETDDRTTEDGGPTPSDGLPRPAKWKKRMGLAGLASLGGFVAWIFGRRDKPTGD